MFAAQRLCWKLLRFWMTHRGSALWIRPECLQHTAAFQVSVGWVGGIGAGIVCTGQGGHRLSSGNSCPQGLPTGSQKLHRRACGDSIIALPILRRAFKDANTRALGAEVVLL